MTSPSNGSTVSGTISVAATATDNVGVTRVDFFRDGNLYATTARPRTRSVSTRNSLRTERTRSAPAPMTPQATSVWHLRSP